MSEKPDLKVVQFPKPNGPLRAGSLAECLRHIADLLEKDLPASKELNNLVEGVIVLRDPKDSQLCTIQLCEIAYHDIIGILADAQFSIQMCRRLKVE